MQAFYVPGTFYVLNHLTLMTIPQERPYNYHYFTDEELRHRD